MNSVSTLFLFHFQIDKKEEFKIIRLVVVESGSLNRAKSAFIFYVSERNQEILEIP